MNAEPLDPNTPMHSLIRAELEHVREQSSDGLLRASEVVSYAAAHPGSALYSRFEWDDTKAAHEYRLEQARGVIQAIVTHIPNANAPMRAYVSLEEDRRPPGGGYRTMTDVLGNRELRAILLRQAFAEFDRWRARYHTLTELAPVDDAVALVRTQAQIKEGVAAIQSTMTKG